MDKDIKEAIDTVISKGATYADIRCSDKEVTSLTQKNGKIEDITTGSSFAAGFRVLYKGSWGFASTDDISRLAGIADTAFRIAKS
ncbi:MAG: TldD/PmbA family protein, partial [Candidatus Aenigmarchaeota archaeon]|nr:TldD/PmbA family protein [Candidatus Aenigmarchaeota archaeon]